MAVLHGSCSKSVDLASDSWHNAAMKKRCLIVAVGLVTFICLVLGVLLMLPPHHSSAKANFDRVKIGMPYWDEIELMLGNPGDYTTGPYQGKRITLATVIISSRLDLDKCTSEESLPDITWFTEEMKHGSFQSRFAA
jgi:hypothetical protein